jgi:iron complex transport system ATP-binding protein
VSGLAAERVSVRLGGRLLLDGIELALKPGEVTAIVGPNGAGKSTLMTCLAGLRRPERGRVSLDGRPLSALSDRARAQRIGYLPQTPEIAWPLDVHTFVRLGRTAHQGLFGESPADAAAVDAALARTDVADFADRAITSLSGGERARVLIARALAGQPEWLIADEPLTGLDLGHQLDAARLLRGVAEDGVGVLASLHDLSFAARVADRIVVMAEGRILAAGPPNQALSPEVLRRAYQVEADWVEAAGGRLLDIRGRDG